MPRGQYDRSKAKPRTKATDKPANASGQRRKPGPKPKATPAARKPPAMDFTIDIGAFEEHPVVATPGRARLLVVIEFDAPMKLFEAAAAIRGDNYLGGDIVAIEAQGLPSTVTLF